MSKLAKTKEDIGGFDDLEEIEEEDFDFLGKRLYRIERKKKIFKRNKRKFRVKFDF